MPTFKFEAMDTTGEEVKDQIEALNEEEAQQKIKPMGYFVTKLTQTGAAAGGKKGKGKAGARKANRSPSAACRRKSLCTFTRQFSTLQDAGLPVLRSLKILEGQMRPACSKTPSSTWSMTSNPAAPSPRRMGKHPKAFDRLYVNMVKAGEAGGALEVILQRLADFKEKSQALKRKVIGAMVYPAVVILVAVGIVTFIMVYIIPKFKKIFDEFGLPLPEMTQLLISVSMWFADYWWVLPLFPLGFWLLIKLIRLSRVGRYAVDWVRSAHPDHRQDSRKDHCRADHAHARHAGGVRRAHPRIAQHRQGDLQQRRLRTLLSKRLRIDPRGRIDRRPNEGKPAGRRHGREHDRGRRRDRRSRHHALQDRRLLRRGSGHPVKGLVSLLEPIMIVILGGIIGFIVISLFLPLIKLLEGLSK